jgi:hypothetical protein
MSDAQWASAISSYNEVLMAYQPGNTVFIELLEKLGAPISSEVKRNA